MSSLSTLGSQVKLRLLPQAKPQQLECMACEGQKGQEVVYYDHKGPIYEEWIDCELCQGTGLDDPLLVAIKNGELVPPVEE